MTTPGRAGAHALGDEGMAVLDALDFPVIVVGCDRAIARFNRASETVLGLGPSDVGRSIRDVRLAMAGGTLEKLCAQVIADGVPIRREFRDGERWFLVRVAPHMGGEHPAGAVLTFTNVTGFRASIEQAIYEREYTKAILNTVSEPLVVLDADLRVQTANRAFYAMFRVLREETQGARLDALANHEWRNPGLWDRLRAVCSEGQELEGLEIEHDLPVLGRRILLLSARRLAREDSGDCLGLVAIRDITEKKRAEDALRVSEERYRMLFSSMDEGFCTIEVLFDEHDSPVDYRYLEVNDAFAKQTGIQDAQGRRMREIAPLHEQHWFDLYGRIALTGEPMRFERPARALQRWYEVSAFRIGPPESRQVAVLFNDITRRRQIEEDLRESGREKDEFLAMLAHELRGPLAPLRNTLELMKRADSDNPAICAARLMMDRQVHQLTRLTDDLLDVNRISRGRIELKREKLELAGAVAQAVEACQPLALLAGHEVHVSLPAAPIHLDADPVRLVQILGNLLNNACKYTPPGGSIWLSAEPIDSASPSPKVLIRVRDTGIGIPPEKLGTIFSMFAQIDRTLERTQGGLGIGLTIVKRLVEMHGGSVEASSEGAGRGSVFAVRLPVLGAAQSDLATTPAAASAGAAKIGRRILVVDDNRDSATSLVMLLECTGNETYAAHDGLEALELAERVRPDVMLLDIGLPRLNGYDVARRIREQSWGRSIVLVALTGWGQEDDRRQSKDAGFDVHMVKPVDYEALTKLLSGTDA